MLKKSTIVNIERVDLMFISVLDIFKIGVGPSSSHTMGPMIAAGAFLKQARKYLDDQPAGRQFRIRCTLRGSLAYTGEGHATDTAILLGLHGHTPESLVGFEISGLRVTLAKRPQLDNTGSLICLPKEDIVFDRGPALPQHPNGMIFDLLDGDGTVVLTATFFSIGGGFLSTPDDIDSIKAPIRTHPTEPFPYPFASAKAMLAMAIDSGRSIGQMKRANELLIMPPDNLDRQLDRLWECMRASVVNGLSCEGILPGSLQIKRRARRLYSKITEIGHVSPVTDWLCTYAMAVAEENAAGHMVVTAPTNGAAGVIPAVAYYAAEHLDASDSDIRTFLLTAAAIGGLIKHLSSISGAEVGCQGEIGSASAMAAAGLCAILGGSAMQVEQAAEIALEHHLGLTCDPVAGLVQIPCIERNGFGAVKAYTATRLALLGDGTHYMMLDNCISAMKQTGLEMSEKFKETSLGGLATNYTEC